MHPSDLRLLFSLGLGQSNGPAGGRTGAESGVHRRHSLYVRVCSAAPRATPSACHSASASAAATRVGLRKLCAALPRARATDVWCGVVEKESKG